MNNSTAETTRIVLDAKEGSREAFAQLVRLNQQPVRTFLYRYLPRGDGADDLAQDVFLVAFRRIGEYRGEATFSSWLLGIARNLALEHLRRESRRKRRDVQAAVARWQAERLGHGDLKAAEHERRLAALRDCVDALPETSRWVVERFYFDSQPSQSIARQMNKKDGAVRMLLLRIRSALGECVESRLQGWKGDS